MIAEPLEKGLADCIQNGMFFKPDKRSILADLLVNQFDWDELTANSVWAFGPTNTGSNMLIDYSLESEVDKNRLKQV